VAGIAVRNGSIENFAAGVDLGSGAGSIVEGLRVFGVSNPDKLGIAATGIVKGNTVTGFDCGIFATGIVTGNYTSGNRGGICVGAGSTVIGNTATRDLRVGIFVVCPSNVTDNTTDQLELSGNGCNNTNNVAP
jgi:hypothetical protein